MCFPCPFSSIRHLPVIRQPGAQKEFRQVWGLLRSNIHFARTVRYNPVRYDQTELLSVVGYNGMLK